MFLAAKKVFPTSVLRQAFHTILLFLKLNSSFNAMSDVKLKRRIPSKVQQKKYKSTNFNFIQFSINVVEIFTFRWDNLALQIVTLQI